MAAEMKPAYLFAGSDTAKLLATVDRLRSRAEREGGPGVLEVFGGGAEAPDPDELVGSIPAISLIAEHRYLLADGVEKWRATQVKKMVVGLDSLPPDVTVVLVARGSAPKGLGDAVEVAGGDVLTFEAPKPRDVPSWLLRESRERGFSLAPQAARVIVERLGSGTARLGMELDRLALWAGDGGEVTAEDVEKTIADDSERAAWALADAVVSRDRAAAVSVADELLAQGEAVTPLVYGMANRLRSAYQAASGIEAGEPAAKIEAALPMAPYPSKMLVRSVRGVAPEDLSVAIGAVADLEWWTRGGSDYDDAVALTLAVRRAAGDGK